MTRVRVAVYVTRGSDLLVFTQRDDAEAGVQVPAGGVRAGERLDAAAVREVLEETGLSVSAVTPLGVQTDVEGQVTVFAHATTATPLDRWAHTVTGGDSDRGLSFECSFAPAASVSLAGGQGEFLSLLR
ncbi:NUDIX domain-containing protein [Actinosynnema sp. NPDC020468]|uniref:NUDIX hydrolase n=1 Tax=Actinosynnema sp. NPDC020468 TaxID=3154488 RepID=UPI0033EBD183